MSTTATSPLPVPFEAADCKGSIVRDGIELCVRLQGAAEFRVKDSIEHLLSDALRIGIDDGLAQVTVDIRSLTFMDGSCLKVLGRWFQRVSEAGNPFRIVIHSDPSRPWQRRSLPVLTCITGALVTIDTGVETA